MSNSPLNDPLLSAFLDGEVDQAQHKLVEQRIGSDQGLRTLLQQWKVQGDAIRSLPKLQLKGDLSQAVLDEINRRQIAGELVAEPADTLVQTRFDKNVPPTYSRKAWRNSLIAISSLAGMCLVGFFLLSPKKPQQQLASHTDLGRGVLKQDTNLRDSVEMAATQVTADLPVSEKHQADELQLALKKSKVSPDSKFIDSTSEVSDAPIALNETLGTAEPRIASVENAPSNIMSVPAPQAALKSIVGTNSLESLERVAEPELLSKEVVLMESQLVSESGATGLADKAGGGSGSIPADSDPGDVANQNSIGLGEKPVRQTVSIPQVYFVEFTSEEQPLAVVSEVFSQNQIEIRTPEGIETNSPKSSTDVLKTLASQSNHGLEAIYVVATRSQLSRAMAELSDRANISGFEVTSSMLGKMLEPTRSENEPTDPTMDELIANSHSRSSNSLYKDEIQNSQGLESSAQNNAEATIELPVRVRAMAQQLQPIERKQRPSQVYGSKYAGKAQRFGNEQTDSLDRLIHSKTMELNWNHNHPKKAEAAPALVSSGVSEADLEKADLEKADQNIEEDLVQFLLIIRTTGHK